MNNLAPNQKLPPHYIIANNYGADHANKIHSDEGAARYGFAGALVREHSRHTRRILIRERDKTRVIDTDSIDWIEAADYYAMIHAEGRSHLLRETMNELAQRLDPEKFFRAHRSAIVNLERVKEIHPLFRGDRDLVLADGTRVRLSRTRRADFERVFSGPARRTS